MKRITLAKSLDTLVEMTQEGIADPVVGGRARVAVQSMIDLRKDDPAANAGMKGGPAERGGVLVRPFPGAMKGHREGSSPF